MWTNKYNMEIIPAILFTYKSSWNQLALFSNRYIDTVTGGMGKIGGIIYYYNTNTNNFTFK